ncbi:hypothetical protein [Terrisporobacter sp.]
MSIATFLACLYFVFTIILLLKKKTMGNIYIIFGGLTYLFVMLYSYMPNIPVSLQKIVIFIVFSLMISLFGIMNGIFVKIIKRSDKFSEITSAVTSILLIILLFNIQGYISYMYIPLVLVIIQRKLNNMTLKYKNVNMSGK